MSVLNENTIIGASAAGGDYEINHSLRFNNVGGDGASTGKTLARTPSVSSNRRTWTVSMWHKRGDINHVQMQDLFWATGAGGGGDGVVRLRFERGLYGAKDALWLSLDGPSASPNAVTKRLFRDASGWMHIVLRFDTTQATVTDRARIYINGELIPSTDYDFLWSSSWSLLAQNSEWAVNTAGWYNAFGGTANTTPDNVLDGYLADIAFVDGQSLGPDSFGETGDYGEWKPIDVSGLTFGTNGYHLDFADSSAMGNDANGSNNFTLYNITANDQMVDSPTNNFATLNPLSSFTGYATALLSEGNLQASLPDNAEGKGSISVSSGKWYFEGFAKTATSNKLAFGIHKADGIYTGGTSIPNNSSAGLVWFGHNGIQGYASDSSYGTFTTGDIIGVKLDMDSKTIQFTKNGTAQGTKDFSSANFDTVVASVFSGQTSNVGVLNFGADSSFAGNKTPQGNQDSNGIGDFFYPVPSGFLSLCTKSLPDVDVIPSENFNTVLWSGNGSATRSITGVGFEPSMLWAKSRTSASNHNLIDAVRGVDVRLLPASTLAEIDSAFFASLDSDGFSLDNANDNDVNQSGQTYVAWNWKAGGTAVSNTNGSITSSVSANPSAGFSIVSYTGDSSGNATVGHGLSKAPEMVIQKARSEASRNWLIWHEAFNDYDKAMLFNTDVPADNRFGPNAPTASVFGLYNGQGNRNGTTAIAYCFHSVDSYSRVGSYIGNGNVDGPMVHCGFRPAYVMMKNTTTAGRGWAVIDAKRDTSNQAAKVLYPDSSAAEDSIYNQIDILATGFKLRSVNSYTNTSGDNYIFYAVAESPFKHTNAR